MREMGVEPSRIDFVAGLAIAVPGFFIGLVAPFWGRMADIFGHKIMIMRAFVLSTVLFFLFSIVNSAPLFIVLRVLQGLLTGIIASSIALVSASTPREYQNKALRMLAISNLFASTLIPAVGGIIVLAIGLRTSLRMGSFIILLSGLIAYLFIKEPISKERRSRVRGERRGRQKKTLHCAPPEYRAVLVGAIVVSGILNLMRVSAMSMTLVVILKYAPAQHVKMLSSVSVGLMGIWALLSTYGIPHIAFTSSKSSFVTSALCVAVLTLIGVLALLLYPLLGYFSYVVLCAIALGVSDGVEVVMQEVMGRVSYDEHKGKVFGTLTRVAGLSRFLGTMLLSAISGFLGMPFASVGMVLILLLAIVALLRVRMHEKRIRV